MDINTLLYNVKHYKMQYTYCMQPRRDLHVGHLRYNISIKVTYFSAFIYYPILHISISKRAKDTSRMYIMHSAHQLVYHSSTLRLKINSYPNLTNVGTYR